MGKGLRNRGKEKKQETICLLDLRSRKSFYKLGFIQFTITLKLRVAPLGAAF